MLPLEGRDQRALCVSLLRSLFVLDRRIAAVLIVKYAMPDPHA